MQYNRKRRREIEKKLGYDLKKFLADNPGMTENDYRKRKQEMGKQLHLQHTEMILNERIKEEAEREQKMLESLMTPVTYKTKVIKDGMTQEEAMEYIKRNRPK